MTTNFHFNKPSTPKHEKGSSGIQLIETSQLAYSELRISSFRMNYKFKILDRIHHICGLTVIQVYHL